MTNEMDFEQFIFTVDDQRAMLKVTCRYCWDEFQEDFTTEFDGTAGNPLSLVTGWAQVHWDTHHAPHRVK